MRTLIILIAEEQSGATAVILSGFIWEPLIRQNILTRCLFIKPYLTEFVTNKVTGFQTIKQTIQIDF
jgi:hypothetical protein